MLSGGVRTLITVIPMSGRVPSHPPCERRSVFRTRRISAGYLSDDVNGNGRIDFADIVWLFNHL